jgi:hypothetical protein
MSTSAQVAANQANAQHSTGPKTADGKSNSSQNRLKHGLAGEFRLLANEIPLEYDRLSSALETEYRPVTPTERILVERMTQYQWLIQRALHCQAIWFETNEGTPRDERSLALFIRYGTTNERAFSKCLNDLLKVRAEKRKQQIGFERQKMDAADQTRKQALETRKQDKHKWDIWMVQMKLEHQELVNAQLETPETRIPNRVQRILAREQAA